LLILILAEAAIETVPQSLWEQPTVRRHAKKRGKPARFILLDRSYHHGSMKKLDGNLKRGRPDIVHFTLLEALGSPLNKTGELQVYVHTVNDQVITVNSKARLPKNYNRFLGLMEQLFEVGKVPPSGNVLLQLEHKTLLQLFNETEPTHVMGFSRTGIPSVLEEAVSRLSKSDRPAVIIGGFPKGHFSETTHKLMEEVICIDPEMLEAWTVASRIIYEYECSVSLPEKRLTSR
jgi:rRNA small subunit pseudouridine methyltransferase Nep1